MHRSSFYYHLATEPLKSLDSRGRFNSLDSGCLLSSPVFDKFQSEDSPTEKALPPTPISPPKTDTLSPNAFLAPPPGPTTTAPADSIALRAIRSMRSLARMTSWAQLKNEKDDENALAVGAHEPLTTSTTTMKTKSKGKENGEGECQTKGVITETIRACRPFIMNRIFAKPKSAILTDKFLSVKRMFSGLMSRWTILRSCKYFMP